MLERFGMMDSKHILTPLGAQFKLSDDMSRILDVEKFQMAKTPCS